MSNEKLSINVPERWEFNAEVAENFTKMLTASIPAYENMRELLVKANLSFLKQESYCLDLGCSNGELVYFIASKAKEHFWYYGCDVSEPMLNIAKQRFSDNPRVKIEYLDLRRDFPILTPNAPTAVNLCLTLQFLPVEYRSKLLAKSFDLVNRCGGCLLLVEKILAKSWLVEQFYIDEYYDLKFSNGYTLDDIQRKRLSLEGVLVPLTLEHNISLLKDAGFRTVESFWQHLNFAGLIAIP